MTLEEITAVATEVVKEYKVDSIQDIVNLKDKLSIEKFVRSIKLKAWDIKSLKIIWGLGYSKIEKLENWVFQYIDRWWTIDSIENIIKSPTKLWKSINNYDWVSNPATVFYHSDNWYMVVDDITWMIIQISDKKDLDWLLDGRIYDLIEF